MTAKKTPKLSLDRALGLLKVLLSEDLFGDITIRRETILASGEGEYFLNLGDWATEKELQKAIELTSKTDDLYCHLDNHGLHIEAYED